MELKRTDKELTAKDAMELAKTQLDGEECTGYELRGECYHILFYETGYTVVINVVFLFLSFREETTLEPTLYSSNPIEYINKAIQLGYYEL